MLREEEMAAGPRTKMRRRVLIVAVFVGMCVVAFLGWCFWNVFCRVQVLPELREIASVHASARFIEDRHISDEGWMFEVQEEDWAPVFSCLTPAEHDWFPAKWQKLGWMTIWMKDGREVLVGLYDPDEREGAFSVGPSLQHRSYYRGGDTARLRDALRAAYANWKKNKSP